MRTRRDLLAGLGAAIALAGCTGNGGEGGTTAPDTTTTTGTSTEPAPDDTTTPENTPEETPTDTSGDTPEETPTPTPEPDPKSFDEIYQENMVYARGAGENTNWDQIKRKLENENGHDLDNLEVDSKFIEDLASWVNNYKDDYVAAEALAYGLYEEFDVGTDQVIVDARTANDGTQGHMTSILIKQSDGGVVKDTDLPIDSDPLEEGNPGYKRHDENTNLSKTEQSLKDIWTADESGISSPLDIDGFKAFIDTVFGGKIQDDGFDRLHRENDDFIIGYESDGEGEIGYTPEGAQLLGQTLDQQNIYASPDAVGNDAWKIVTKGTEFAYNKVKGVEDTYMEFHHAVDESEIEEYSEERDVIDLESVEGKLVFDTVGEERNEELKRAPYQEYT